MGNILCYVGGQKVVVIRPDTRRCGVFEETVHKLLMGLTPDDVRAALEAGAGKEMDDLVKAMGWLAFRWWSAPGQKDPKTVQEIQDRLGTLQLMLHPKY
jgi:hypothetical protein